MKEFLAFVKIEFFHIFRDKRTMLILLGMPIAQILLFGFAITTEVKDARVMVLGYTGDPVEQRLVERLEQNAYFSVVGFLHTDREAHEAFRKNEADLVVAFPPGFAAEVIGAEIPAVQLLVDGTDPNTAHLMKNYAQAVITSALSGQLPSAQTSAASLSAPPVSIHTHMLFNPQMKSAYNFVPGVMGLILMLICTMMTSVSIVREKETGTMEVLLASPIRPIFIILAKAVPYFLLSCVNLATILLLSVYVLEVPIAGSLLLLSFVSMLLILVALSLGLLVSTLVDTQVAAMLISGMTLMMPVMLLSGLIFPVESMPVPLQWLSNIIPAKWYILAVKKIMIEGVGLRFVWQEILILSGMAALLMTVSLKHFRERLQ